MRDPFPIVCKLGDRLVRERTGWRDVKALVLIVAQHGDWNGATALADALGIPPEQQEAIYHEANNLTGGATPAPHHHRKRTPA